MKVIFLDFDGVITIPPKWYLQADLIKNVKKIVDKTGAKIVVSSSWRMDTVEETIDKMIGRPKRCPRNRMLNWLIDNLYDVTHTYKGLRGQEIKDWLNDRNDIENYVIKHLRAGWKEFSITEKFDNSSPYRERASKDVNDDY